VKAEDHRSGDQMGLPLRGESGERERGPAVIDLIRELLINPGFIKSITVWDGTRYGSEFQDRIRISY
jgi:hypothetical protein